MEAKRDQDTERPTRTKKPTWKSLELAINEKTKLFWKSHKYLEAVVNDLLRADPSSTEFPGIVNIVKTSYTSLNDEVSGLKELYSSDKADQNDLQALLVTAKKLFDIADGALSSAEHYQPAPPLQSVDDTNRRSHRSASVRSTSTSSSAKRLEARARLAEEKAKFQFDKRIRQQKLKQAEIEFELQLITSQRNLEMAEATAKVYECDDIPEPFVPPEKEIGYQTATKLWLDNEVQSNIAPPPPFDVTHDIKPNIECKLEDFTHGFAGNEPLFKPVQQEASFMEHCIGMQQDTNRKLIAALAKQALPKCEPDVFTGDAALFLPWKMAFRAMMQDVDASPEQELNLLLRYTAKEPKNTVNTFRRRIHPDSKSKVTDLWKALELRYGNKAQITNALVQNLQEAAIFKPDDRLGYQTFADICEDVNSQIPYLNGLSILNSSFYMKTLVEKLPKTIKEKWENKITKLMVGQHADDYPPFFEFVKVVQTIALKRNHPAIVKVPGADFDSIHNKSKVPAVNQRQHNMKVTRTSKTDIGDQQQSSSSNTSNDEDVDCPLHHKLFKKHSLLDCRLFAEKTVDEREKIVKDNRICFRCLVKKHFSRRCPLDVKCDVCGERHQTLFHRYTQSDSTPKPASTYSGEQPEKVESACSQICGNGVNGKSCGKIVLGEIFDKNNPTTNIRSYITLDDQSNHTLATVDLFDSLNITGNRQQYTMETCHGMKSCYGRRGMNLAVRALDGRIFDLPTVIEYDNLPQDKREIPTPDVIDKIPHLKSIADCIPPFEETTSICLLIGRDAPELLKVRDFINGPPGAPWAQLLDLGWTVSGELCLDRQGGRVHVSACRTLTGIQHDFQPCEYQIRCKEKFNFDYDSTQLPDTVVSCHRTTTHHQDALLEIAKDVFRTTEDDTELGTSPEDRQFLNCMEEGFHINPLGNWEAPLPFRNPEVTMPDNHSHVAKRFRTLQKNFVKNPQLQRDYFEFMNNIIQRGHASRVPDYELATEPGRKWLLPHFAVYHPQKPTKIRVVFDSSSEYGGTSLNQELLPGPDLMNKLLGRLLRFRQHSIGIMCDIEQMFHSFYVNCNHRDFLRFLWFADDDVNSAVVEYRMNVHLFGNGPSPAIATYGLRKSAEDPSNKYGKQVCKFVKEDFYVDDGVYSCKSSPEAIHLLKSTQEMLMESNLRLHKVVSNDLSVMKAFPHEDLAKGLTDLDFDTDKLPCQRTLGVRWDLEEDAFTFKVNLKDKPYTRRGVLSIINSLYDPFGFLAPFTIRAKKILQILIQLGNLKGDPLLWDDPLPTDLETEWYKWCNDLQSLGEVVVPRCYKVLNSGEPTRIELHAFSDASKDALGVVLYLRIYYGNGTISVSFVRGSAKVRPQKHLSIPRMELCAAVLLVTTVKQTLAELEYSIDSLVYYTDSKVVLGYIANESRRFFVYVANRVEVIRSLSSPEAWRFIKSENNPADVATRGCSSAALVQSSWLIGPAFLSSGEDVLFESHHLLQDDQEVRNAKVCTSGLKIEKPFSLASYFAYFSSWSRLCRSIARFKLLLRQKKLKVYNLQLDTQLLFEAEAVILQHVQQEAFPDELKILQIKSADNSKRQLRGFSLHNLDPFIEENLIRVGGRLRRADLLYPEKHPIILPKDNHVSRLIAQHHHEKTFHQGRSITHGAIRQAGYWIISGSSVVNALIQNCIKCKLLRKPTITPKMADLPEDRVTKTPPFTNVGMDAFGPWEVSTRKSRSSSVNSKRWGIIFTCLYCQTIHIEVVDSMDTSAFINAMRRFFAIRGPVTTLRSDCGTNFVGASNELREALKEINDDQVKQFLLSFECQWIWNPPHASHFGGVWERQIGTLRRVLEGMLLELGRSQLTHDLLVTLMSEAAAIVNSRPLSAVPVDPDNPMPLSPTNILTMKTRPYAPSPGDFVEPDLYCRRRWRRTQYLADQFWIRWKREYLHQQQKRRKWTQSTPNLAVDDIVLIHDKTAHRGLWPRGRVTKAEPGADGIVRHVAVEVYEDDDPTSKILKGRRKQFLRPSTELLLLYRDQKV